MGFSELVVGEATSYAGFASQKQGMRRYSRFESIGAPGAPTNKARHWIKARPHANQPFHHRFPALALNRGLTF